MSFDLIPRSFFNWPSNLPNLLEDEDWKSFLPSSGLTVSEDDNCVYVETALPGLSEDDIDLTYDKGILWVRGNKTEEEKEEKKYYRKASSNFSYRVAIPADVDPSIEPEAVLANGIMKITFIKKPEVQPKKIAIKKINDNK